MSNEPKVIFDPKLNFELPREIGPLLSRPCRYPSLKASMLASIFLGYAEYSRKL